MENSEIFFSDQKRWVFTRYFADREHSHFWNRDCFPQSSILIWNSDDDNDADHDDGNDDEDDDDDGDDDDDDADDDDDDDGNYDANDENDNLERWRDIHS